MDFLKKDTDKQLRADLESLIEQIDDCQNRAEEIEDELKRRKLKVFI
jgi:hypothetical protein